MGLSGPKKKIAGEREFDMRRLYKDGKTLQEIGDKYGITRERVRQILTNEFGLHAEDGGRNVRANLRALNIARCKFDERAEKNRRFEEICGCSMEVIRELSGGYTPISAIRLAPNTPGARWAQQKRNAIHRGIEWNLTLPEWWRIWQESGHWDERGRGQGYVMARLGDSGPYSADNVYICTAGQNSADSYIAHPAAERAVKAAATRAARMV